MSRVERPRIVSSSFKYELSTSRRRVHPRAKTAAQAHANDKQTGIVGPMFVHTISGWAVPSETPAAKYTSQWPPGKRHNYGCPNAPLRPRLLPSPSVRQLQADVCVDSEHQQMPSQTIPTQVTDPSCAGHLCPASDRCQDIQLHDRTVSPLLDQRMIEWLANPDGKCQLHAALRAKLAGGKSCSTPLCASTQRELYGSLQMFGLAQQHEMLLVDSWTCPG